MQITDILAQVGGLQSLARELGINEQQAADGAAALTPAILGGFKKQAQAQPTGLDGLGQLIGKLGGGSLLENVLGAGPTNVSQGNEVLGQIFGSKDVSRTVAKDAASKTGLDASLLKKMLPMLAMMVTGYLATRAKGDDTPQAPTGSSGGLGDMLGGLLGGRGAEGVSTGGGSTGMAGMLDLNGDGNSLDDIMRMAGKVMR